MNRTGAISSVVVVVLGAVWGAATGYSSYQTESYYQAALQNFNAKTLSPVSIKLTSFKRGFLHSRANWEISLTLNPCEPNNNLVLTGYDEISHGPIPSLGWASIDSHIIWPDAIEPQIRQIFKGQQPLSMHSRINLLGGLSTRLTSPAIEWQGQQFKLNWQGLKGNLSLSGALSSSDTLTFDIKAPKLIVTANNTAMAPNQQQVSMEGIRYQGEQRHSGSLLPLGKTTFSVNRLTTGQDQQQWAVQKLVLSNNTQINKGMLSALGQYQIKKIQLNQQDIGDFKASVRLEHLSAQAAQQSYQAINRLQRQCNPSMKDLLKALQPVLNEGFQVNLSQADLKLFKGSAQANALLMMPALKDRSPQSMEQIIQAVRLNGKLQVSEQLLSGLLTQLSQLQGQAISPAEASQNIQMLVQGVLEQGYLTKTATGYQTTLAVNQGQASINGKALGRPTPAATVAP